MRKRFPFFRAAPHEYNNMSYDDIVDVEKNHDKKVFEIEEIYEKNLKNLFSGRKEFLKFLFI